MSIPNHQSPALQSFITITLFCLMVSFSAAETWTLSRALQQARKANPDMVSARHRIASAQAALLKARSALWPRIVAETGYMATNNPPAVFMAVLNQRQLTFDRDFNDPDTTDNWGSELRVEYSLYTGGARKADIEAATLGVSAANDERLAIEQSLALQVAEAYYRVFQARDLVSIASDSLQSHRANLAQAKKLVASKVALQTAVLDLEVKVAEGEANLEVARGAQTIRKEFLQMLLGHEDHETLSVSEEMTILAPVAPHENGERYDLLALARRRSQADQGVRVAKAGQRPTVGAYASTRHDEGFTESDGGNSWGLGLSLSWNVFDGGKTLAEIRSAEAQRALAHETERKKHLAIRLEIAKAQTSMTTAHFRITHARKAIASAKESLAITQARFRDGLALATQLIDAETALLSANVRIAQARTEEQIALAHHRYALGLPILESSTPTTP